MSAAVKVDIRQLPHGEGLALPAYQSAHAAGLDLLAAVPEDAPMMLAPGKHALVPTGLTIALPPGYEAQVRPRSGLAAKHGVTVLNSPGTVDADYRGEIGVLLINHGDAPFPIRRGERIAQMVIAPVARRNWFPSHRFPPPTAAAAVSARPGADPHNRPIQFYEIRANQAYARIFLRCSFAFTVWTLTRRLPLGILSLDSRTAGKAPGAMSCGLGQTMSGVIAAMRRTLLSCTSLARDGLIVLGTATLLSTAPAHAGDAAVGMHAACSISTTRNSRC